MNYEVVISAVKSGYLGSRIVTPVLTINAKAWEQSELDELLQILKKNYPAPDFHIRAFHYGEEVNVDCA